MFDYRRTHTCGELRSDDIDQTVTLSGWVHRTRNLGGIIFIALRDRYGITQVIFDPNDNLSLYQKASLLKNEWVISVQGTVLHRAKGSENNDMPTGAIEIKPKHIEILSEAKTPPFVLNDETTEANEELRLTYRYLDIRKGFILKNMELRHKAMLAARNYLDRASFTEVQTPILSKSTPEGAREYLVPSRIHPGNFYALPQSPQIYKQLLMIAGLDRYYQFAPCFRDEDLRAERQPEFTQIDIEMSFGIPDDIQTLTEGLLKEIFKHCLHIEISTPFRRMTYYDCMENYGTDKPDLRFGMPLVRIDDLALQSDFSVFKSQLNSGGIVKGFCVKNGAEFSRKKIDDYTQFVSNLGLKGLAWLKKTTDGFSSSLVKYFSEHLLNQLSERLDMQTNDLVFFAASSENIVNQSLDHLRRQIAKDLNLIKPNTYEFLWVTDFPLFEWDSEENRLTSVHHPFTSPHFDDIPKIESDPLNVRSYAYDIVLNGYEIGGGSQRIHNQDLQRTIFEVLKLSEDDLNQKMGFFLEALKYGTPPHLGIALGFDRIIMLICHTENIKDVIAFPKSLNASDLMMHSPSHVTAKQLAELKIQPFIEKNNQFVKEK